MTAGFSTRVYLSITAAKRRGAVHTTAVIHDDAIVHVLRQPLAGYTRRTGRSFSVDRRCRRPSTPLLLSFGGVGVVAPGVGLVEFVGPSVRQPVLHAFQMRGIHLRHITMPGARDGWVGAGWGVEKFRNHHERFTTLPATWREVKATPCASSDDVRKRTEKAKRSEVWPCSSNRENPNGGGGGQGMYIECCA